MTHDKNEPLPETQTWIAPELEARIVAWIAAEAAPFEVAELTRLVAEKPELAIFKRRIEAVHGLVAEAARPDPEPLQLSPERRAKLLQTLGAAVSPAAAGQADQPVVLTLPAARRRPWHVQAWIVASSAAAACLALGVFLTQRSEPTYLIREDAARAGIRLAELDQAVREESPDEPTRLSKAKEGALLDAVTEFEGTRPKVDARTFAITGGSVAANKDEAVVQADGRAAAARGSQIPGESQIKRRDSNVDTDGARSNGPRAIIQFPRKLTSSDDSNAPVQFSQPVAVGLAAAGGAGEKILQTRQNGASADLRGFMAETKNESGQLTLSSPASIALGMPAAADAEQENEKKQQGDADKPLARPATPVVRAPDAPETSTAKEPVSTFSLHVSDVSFRLAQAALARGERPDAERIRTEEFYNAFDYGDPVPSLAEKVSCRIEQSAHPLLQQRNLVRIAMKVAATGRGTGTPLRLTVLLDSSGSMEREDRAATVRRAVEVLASLLGPADRITLISFARQPRLLAEAVAGDQAGGLVDLVARTPFEGGTNLEAALKLSGELALRHRAPGALNRIVLLTDGAANLGNADPAQLALAIDTLRRQGIAFDACGVGLDGLDDEILESLTRQGDGRYYVLGSPAAADAGFAQQLAGAFRPAAENVKLQVRFNPARVGRYRLIGFEQHRLREEDFRNDRVDAAELAGEEAAVALYQVEVLPQGDGELGEVFVRFRDAATGLMVERSWTISHESHASAFDRAAPSMQLAGTAALLAEKLRGGAVANQIRLAELAPVVNSLRSHFSAVPRVQELTTMFVQLRRLSGE